MNADLVKQALELVRSPYVLVNLISRRVRQLNAGGRINQTLLPGAAGRGAADVALLEIIEGKMGFDLPALVPLTRFKGSEGRKPRGWGNPPPARSTEPA
jgi:DNA-directed RNA polymerase subunit omega